MRRRFNLAKMILLFIVIAPVAIFLFGMVVMYLWNNALAPVLHISTVTFWQGLGIMVLCKILFSSFSGRRSRRYPTWKERMTQKWNNMTPEEKEKFRERWNDKWWKMGFKPWDSDSDIKQPGAGGT